MRYPGGKGKLAKQIMAVFPCCAVNPLFSHASKMEYREPFFGSGSIGLNILAQLPRACHAWINDIDYWLYCYWKSCQDAPRDLARKIIDFIPSTESFYEYKEADGSNGIDPVEAGFRKLALHQMSFSGLGSVAGGPIGGKTQDTSGYNIACRWKPEREVKKVSEYHRLLGGVKITCMDFKRVIDGSPEQAFIYADPPYVDAGPELYKHHFTEEDHRRLYECLKTCKATWVVSYDDHPLVRQLYAEFTTTQASTAYTISHPRKHNELMITNAEN